MKKKPRKQDASTNRIPLPFEKAVEGLLAVKPKKKAVKEKKKSLDK